MDFFCESSYANLANTWIICVDFFISSDDEPSTEIVHVLLESPPRVERKWGTHFEELSLRDFKPLPSYVQPPKLELKPLPLHLMCAFLSEEEILPVVISFHLDKDQKKNLLNVLRGHKGAMKWTITNIKGISPLVCTHKSYWDGNRV